MQALLGSDNERRAQAEAFVNELPQTNFNGGIDMMLGAMGSNNYQIAAMGAVLLKKKYCDVEENFKEKVLDKMDKNALMKELNQKIKEEKPYLSSKK